MKKTFLISLMMTFASFAWAERFTDHIHSVAPGNTGEEHLLLLSSGRVVFLDPDQTPQYEISDFDQGDRVELEVDEDLTLESATTLPPLVDVSDELPLKSLEIPDPTILPDYEAANSIFSRMNRSWKRQTECTDRAHVWTYEEWKKHGLVSNKVFLFFTNTYIRRYRFNWWFHVSPFTLVQSAEAPVEYVMDRRFTRTPYLMKDWTDVFIRSKKACSERTYAYYRAHKNSSEHCYVVKTSMYYRLPYHVRMMEDNGVVKTKFSTSEVNFSYRAFSRRGAK